MNEMTRPNALHLINTLKFTIKCLEDAIKLEEAEVINFALIAFASGVAWAKYISTARPDLPGVHAAPHSANVVHDQDPALALVVHAAPPSTHVDHVQNPAPAPVVPHATTRTGTNMTVNISFGLEDMISLREGEPQHTASSSKRTTKKRERSVAQSNVTKKCRMTS